MTDAILSASIEFLGQLLADEVRFLKGVREEVELLRQNLEHLLWFLRSADKKQDVRESIKHWVSEFSGIAYEAANLVEDYAFRVEAPKRNLAGGCTYKLQRYACVFSQSHTLHDLGIEIQSLNTRISNLTQKFKKFGVPGIMEGEGSSRSSVQQQLRRTYSFKAEEDLTVGPLENDVHLLVHHLQNNRVVSIFGMGGIGKTTLARKLYHHLRLKQCFQAFAWCCISQKWETEDILQRILVELIPDLESTIKSIGRDGLVAKLRQVMQDRRCFIVLDDMWSADAWNCIKDAICISEHGSKILLTTRNRDVAEHLDPDGYHHQPKLLTEEESLELLKQKCLKETSSEDLYKFEDIGKKMLQQCRGLPLAVVALCGVLKTKKSLREWHDVHEDVKSYLARGEKIGKKGEVSNVLDFSYHDLPYQLKPCFLYLGKFKEDSDIGVERLYQLWIAEGMVLANDRRGQKTMMDVAECYLEELANRCMVQVELHEEGQPTITKFKSCQLHDLMRDLCLEKAKEANLYKVIDLGHQIIGVPSANSYAVIEKHYRFVIRCLPEDFDNNIFPPKDKTKHLRSFWCEQLDYRCDGRRIMSQVNNFKMLRVLIIEGYNMKSTRSLLECIGHLIHLRCLTLRRSIIWKLPSSLGNLKYLETLDLTGTTCSRVANVLWKLSHLRHLYVSGFEGKLRLDRLLGQQLEILEGISNRNCDFKNLFKLTNLRALKVRVYNNLEDVEQIVNYISSLNYIRSTSLDIWDCDFGIEYCNSYNNKGLAVLEQVLFCKNLHKLVIDGTLCKQLPNYQPHLFASSGLTELWLKDSKIKEDPMPTLEKFPNLRILRLDYRSFVGKEMICHAMGFPQLKVLWLQGLENLEKWEVDEGAMPKLSSLEIWRCEKLEMIPDGLRSITTLSELKIWGMPEEFRNRVQIVNGVKGPDFDKIRHVPSINHGSCILSQSRIHLKQGRQVSKWKLIQQGKMRPRDNCSSSITAFK